ncbi:MAG: leucyl aminopeptidase family protein [Deltaproteobacteria bacterium]|nr:leucyl aminopeptidase family protein [Deltaproteobacteria bacterium]
MSMPSLRAYADLDAALADDTTDGVVLITGDVAAAVHPRLDAALAAARAADAQLGTPPGVLVVPGVPGGRVVVAVAGPLDRDQDDVRAFRDAGQAALARARDAGLVRPLVVVGGVPAGDARYVHATAVAFMGALAGLWQPLEAREHLGEEAAEPVRAVALVAPDAEAALRVVEAVEEGRRLARDLGGTEPERMAAPRFAQAVLQAFEGTEVEVEVLSDREAMEPEYPLLMAVARASQMVEAHHPRVVRMSYTGPGPVQRTLLLAGKGVTYDTGGADLKTGGAMAGMSRDKLGAAAVAGFVKTAALLATPGVKVVAELGLVRNSVGARGFVADEIITAHSGCRVRIGDTDAEGRLVLADLLSHLRARAKDEVAPELFSVATLTGHAYRAVGPFTIALDNGPARAAGTSPRLQAAGEAWGEPVEVSRLRKEDFDFIRPRTPADDVLSCNNAPSSATARGHQFPMAFLVRASGLEPHGTKSAAPLPYTHVDVGGSACEGGDWQHGRPTGTPLVALTAAYLL